MEDLHFRPPETLLRLPALLLIFAALFAGIELSFGGELWPVFPVPSRSHLLAWLFVAMVPVALVATGFAYTLTARELVVSRFGRERFRVPLSAYRGRAMRLSMPRLDFGSRSIVVFAAGTMERAAFLAALDERAVASGSGALQSFGATVVGERVTVRIGGLRFPDRCACCDRDASTHVDMLATRGLDLVVFRYERVVTIRVPVCDEHAARHRNIRWLAYGAVFLVVTMVLFALFEGATADTMLSLGVSAMLGAFAMRVAEAFKLTRFASYHALGVAAVGLDAELTRVTLRIRDPGLRQALSSDGSLEPLARVFA